MKIADALKIISGPLIVLVINEISIGYNLYERYATYDVGMHALGGGAIALSWILLVEALLPKLIRPLWYDIVVTLGIVALVATFWEFYEFVLDQGEMIPLRQLSLVDTIGDYAAGLIGGLFVIGGASLQREIETKK